MPDKVRLKPSFQVAFERNSLTSDLVVDGVTKNPGVVLVDVLPQSSVAASKAFPEIYGKLSRPVQKWIARKRVVLPGLAVPHDVPSKSREMPCRS